MAQMGGRKHSARGLLLKALFDGPGTFEELAVRIGTMPPSGPNRHFVPATTERLQAAMWYVHRRLEEVSHFRVVLDDQNRYSVCLATEKTQPRRPGTARRILRVRS
jgi:hypothetical protein